MTTSVSTDCESSFSDMIGGSTPLDHEQAHNEVATICHSAMSTLKATLNDLKATSQNLFEKFESRVVVTPVTPLITKINRVCHDIERVFNIVGCLPLLGMISGTLRTLIGKVQAVIGASLVALSEIGRFLANKTDTSKDLLYKWEVLSQLGIEHTVHGLLNIIRGTGEMLVGTYSAGLSNTPLFIPNVVNDRNFNPYFEYTGSSQ